MAIMISISQAGDATCDFHFHDLETREGHPMPNFCMTLKGHVKVKGQDALLLTGQW